MAIPTSAIASAGVVDPVADHDDAAQVRPSAQRAHHVDFLLGRLLCVDAVDAQAVADGGGDRPLVARCKRDVADSDLAELADEVRRVVAQPVTDHGHAGEAVVDGDHHFRVIAVDPRRENRLDPVLAQPTGAADENAMLPDDPEDAVAEALLDVVGNRQWQVPLLCCVHQRLRKRMRGESVDRGRETQRLVGRQAVRRDDAVELRMSQRDRSRLVEQDGAGTSESLDRSRPLYDDSGTGGAREARDQCDRRRQDQWARRRDDKHGKRADRIPGDRPGKTRHDHRRRQEEDRITVGEAHERCTLVLGLRHQAHERRIGALGRRPKRPQFESGTGCTRAAAHAAATANRDRQRFAGERRLVDDRLVTHDQTVDRHDLARADEDDLVRDDVADRDLDQIVAAVDERGPWRALDERGQLATRTTVGGLLERVAACEHQRDHCAREVLAERNRTGHREERDRVDADVAAQQRTQNRPGQRQEQHRRRRSPQPVGEAMVVEARKGEA
jgi:hypothetical protein